MLATLFTIIAPPTLTRKCDKRHRSNHTNDSEDARSRKKEPIDIEAVRRAALVDEEARQMRARELATRASSSTLEVVERSSTDGVYFTVGTSNGGPTSKGASFWTLDLPSC